MCFLVGRELWTSAARLRVKTGGETGGLVNQATVTSVLRRPEMVSVSEMRWDGSVVCGFFFCMPATGKKWKRMARD